MSIRTGKKPAFTSASILIVGANLNAECTIVMNLKEGYFMIFYAKLRPGQVMSFRLTTCFSIV